MFLQLFRGLVTLINERRFFIVNIVTGGVLLAVTIYLQPRGVTPAVFGLAVVLLVAWTLLDAPVRRYIEHEKRVNPENGTLLELSADTIGTLLLFLATSFGVTLITAAQRRGAIGLFEYLAVVVGGLAYLFMLVGKFAATARIEEDNHAFRVAAARGAPMAARGAAMGAALAPVPHHGRAGQADLAALAQ